MHTRDRADRPEIRGTDPQPRLELPQQERRKQSPWPAESHAQSVRRRCLDVRIDSLQHQCVNGERLLTEQGGSTTQRDTNSADKLARRATPCISDGRPGIAGLEPAHRDVLARTLAVCLEIE